MDHIITETFLTKGKQCRFSYPSFLGRTKKMPVVYFPTGTEGRHQLDELWSLILPNIKKGTCRNFAIAGFESNNWNADFSPWPAPAASSKMPSFTGGGPQTLDWMLTQFIPKITSRYSRLLLPNEQTILGYSLAGLFAFWAFLNTDAFQNCGCCSASLWYDEIVCYTEQQTIPQKNRVYLSLGESEEKTHNQTMASVGKNTRRIFTLLQQNSAIKSTTLQWNQGGHFQDIPKRLVHALLWLMAL